MIHCIQEGRRSGLFNLNSTFFSPDLVQARSYVLVQRECVVSPVNNRVCVEFIEMRFYVSSRKSGNKRPRIYLFYQRYFSQNWLPGESIFDQKTSSQNMQNSAKLQ